MNYKLVRGPDNIVWCSIQPLMTDVSETLEKLQCIDLEPLSEIDKDIMEFNIIGMKAIYTFMGALLQEKSQEEHRNATSDRQTTHESH
jgi:hypothetical protein